MQWPEKCEDGCGSTPTVCVGVVGSKPQASALCDDCAGKRAEELRGWVAKNGRSEDWSPAISRREHGGERLYIAIKSIPEKA